MIECNECKYEKEMGKCFHKSFQLGKMVHNDKKIMIWADNHYSQSKNKDGNCELFKKSSIFSFL